MTDPSGIYLLYLCVFMYIYVDMHFSEDFPPASPPNKMTKYAVCPLERQRFLIWHPYYLAGHHLVLVVVWCSHKIKYY